MFALNVNVSTSISFGMISTLDGFTSPCTLLQEWTWARPHVVPRRSLCRDGMDNITAEGEVGRSLESSDDLNRVGSVPAHAAYKKIQQRGFDARRKRQVILRTDEHPTFRSGYCTVEEVKSTAPHTHTHTHTGGSMRVA